MKIEEIGNLEPKEFLEKVKETPYTAEEKRRDLYDLFVLTLKDMFLGSYLQLVGLYAGVQELKNIICRKYYFLNKESVIFLFQEKKIHQEHQEKLLHIVNTTKRLAQKMGVSQVKVGLWLGKKPIDHFSIEHPCGLKFIGLDQEILDADDDEIEYLIAHELAHLQHKDSSKRGALAHSTIGLDFLIMFCLVRWGFNQAAHREKLKRVIKMVLIRGVIQGLAGHLIRKIDVNLEWKADLKACQILNSNTGMIKFFYKIIKEDYGLKHSPILGFNEKEVKKLKRSITPYGNYRGDTKHPPATERLAFALKFKPAQGS